MHTSTNANADYVMSANRVHVIIDIIIANILEIAVTTNR